MILLSFIILMIFVTLAKYKYKTPLKIDAGCIETCMTTYIT